MPARRKRAMPVEEDENNPRDVLTGIQLPYTMAGTNEGSEVYELMIKHFLNTLAEIALSIASRKEVLH